VDVLELDPAGNPVHRRQRDPAVRRLLLSVQEVENPFRTCYSGLQRVVHPGDLGEWLIELAHVLYERLQATQGDLSGRHLQTANHRDRDVAEVADERRER